MTFVHELVGTPMAHAIGWAIFHSVWQGIVAALVLAVAVWVMRSSRARYAAACLALVAIVLAFGVTLVRSIQGNAATPIAVTRAFGQSGPLGARLPEIPIEARIAAVLPWLAPFWIAGMLLFHLRSLASWTMTRRLRTKGVCSASADWQERLEKLRARVQVTKPVVLLEAALAQTPAVLGWIRPVILVPAGMFVGMPTRQIETILVHELAHIRRHDYLVNLVQTIVEGFLFYHPAVWWVSHVIRSERENCCDDAVVAVNGDAREYAAALIVLEENRQSLSEPAVAATGGVLVKRIRRLLYPQENPRAVLTPLISAGVLVLVTALAMSAWQDKPASAYDRWLTDDVPYIINDTERAVYKALATDDEREHFIEQFWERRNPTPGSIENPYKVEHYRRITFANAHFGSQSSVPGWKTDRGRIYITFGPPDEIDSHPNGLDAKPPYETWLYRFIQNIGNNVTLEFDDANRNGEYHMTMDPNPRQGTRVVNPSQQ